MYSLKLLALDTLLAFSFGIALCAATAIFRELWA